MELPYFPEVVQAVPGEARTVYAYFSDGTVRLLDVGPLIERGGVFACLSDEDFFRNRLTVMHGAVAWDVSGTRDEASCIDIDPCSAYEDSKIVADPLGSVA